MALFKSTPEKDAERNQLFQLFSSWLRDPIYRGPEQIHTFTMPAFDWTYEKMLVRLIQQYPEKELFLHCCEYDPDNYWANREFVRPRSANEVQKVANNITVRYALGDYAELMDPDEVTSPEWQAGIKRVPARMHPWADYCGHPMTARIEHLKKFVRPGNLIAATFDCQWRVHPAIPVELIAGDVYRVDAKGKNKVDTTVRARNTHAFVSKQLKQANPTARVVSMINSGYKGGTVPMYAGAFLIQ